MFVYLDNSATTKQYDEVNNRIRQCMEGDFFGNPSSLHRLGIASEKLIREARISVAKTLSARENEIFFTGSGTVSDNVAIRGAAKALKRKGNKIITSEIEHPAVLETCRDLEKDGYVVSYIKPDEYGYVKKEAVEAEIDDNTILISVMSVNNEVGTTQPIGEIGDLKKNREKLYLHTDGVQGYGKIDYKKIISNIDMISVSGHKIHGPKGVGALYVKKGTLLRPIITGGGQEEGVYPGTENVPLITGFGLAAEIIYKDFDKTNTHLKDLKKYFIDAIKSEISDIKVNGFEDERAVPNIVNISFLGVKGEILLHTLEQDNIYVSTGSACSSKKKGQSHVLKSMGLSDKEIEGAIRFSFSEFNTREEIDFTVDKLKKGIGNIRRMVRR